MPDLRIAPPKTLVIQPEVRHLTVAEALWCRGLKAYIWVVLFSTDMPNVKLRVSKPLQAASAVGLEACIKVCWEEKLFLSVLVGFKLVWISGPLSAWQVLQS